MKITSIDTQTKKENFKKIVSIATSGLGLGVTYYLIKNGILNYGQVLDLNKFDSVTTAMQNMAPIMKVPVSLVTSAIKTIGLDRMVLLMKSGELFGKIGQAVLESDKLKENRHVKKIKDVLKLNKEDGEEKRYSGALRGLVSSGLSIGARAFLMANGVLDYNTMDFSKVPHRFVSVLEHAKELDLNRVSIAFSTLKAGGRFVLDRSIEKDNNVPLKFGMSDVLRDISKNIKSGPQIPPYINVMDTLATLGNNSRAYAPRNIPMPEKPNDGLEL